MKKFAIILFSFVLFLTGCDKFKTGKSYYCFRDDDFDKILSFEDGQVIKYSNEDGEEIIFEVTQQNSDYKQQITIDNMIVPPTKLFYYDEKNIELKTFPNRRINYYFRRFPIDFEQAKDNVSIELESQFEASFSIYNWNGYNNGYTVHNDIKINFNAEKETMTINGANYSDVFVFESGSNEPVYAGDTINRYFNKVYYDLHTGIIGFDDLDNNHWRIVN